MVHRWDPEAPGPGKLVRPVRVDLSSLNGPTRRQAAGHYWRRTTASFYAPSDTRTDLPEQRTLEQSVRGVTPMPVPLNVGPHGHIRADSRILLCFHQLDVAERTLRHVGATVTVLRATYDAMRLASDAREAVVATDMMAAAELVSIHQMRQYAGQQPRPHQMVLWALDLASELSRSPSEVRLRLIGRLDADLPPTLANCPVHDRARSTPSKRFAPRRRRVACTCSEAGRRGSSARTTPREIIRAAGRPARRRAGQARSAARPRR